MFGTIYALAEPESGNVRYCGKTVKPLQDRISDHRADVRRQLHRHLYRWLRKVYDAGKEPTVMVCEEVDLDGLEREWQLRLLNEVERRWIAQFKALGFDLTNATDGGDGCHGRIVSEETRRKTAKANTGQKRSSEACANIKLAAQQRCKAGYLRGEAHPQYGKPQQWKDPDTRRRHIRETWNDEKKRTECGLKVSGESNGNRKISANIAIAIYADSRTYREIAVDHGTNISMVSDIKNGTTWRHVTKHDLAQKRTKYKINAELAQQIYVADGPHRSIADRFGISQAIVADIKSGRRWRAAIQLLRNSP